MNDSDKQKLKKKLQEQEVDPRVKDAIKSIVTSINSSIKEVYYSIFEPYELLKEELKKSIYIHPELYKEIEECLLAVPADEVFKVQDGNHEFEMSDLKTKKDGREYFVLTHKCEQKLMALYNMLLPNELPCGSASIQTKILAIKLKSTLEIALLKLKVFCLTIIKKHFLLKTILFHC